jgi:hypothetical protein
MGGSARTIAMEAIGVVAAVAVPFLAPYIAEGLGTLLVGEEAAVIGTEGFAAADAVASATGEAIGSAGVQAASNVLAGTAVGAASGAAQAELAGTDPWQGAFSGAESGAIGGAVSGAVGAVLPTDLPGAITAGIKGGASGTATNLAKGKDLGTSATLGAISGLTAAGTSTLFPEGFLGTQQQTDAEGNPIEGAPEVPQYKDLETALKTIGGSYLKQDISGLFNPKPTTGLSSTTTSTREPTTSIPGINTQGTYTGTGATYSPTARSGGGTGTNSVQTQAAPGSQALAQALGVGAPSLGTSGTAGQTEDPSTGGVPQNVWNQASLRVKDDTGEYS